MDAVREGGIWLAGGKGQVERAIADQKVLERSELGSTVKVMIDAPFSRRWKELAQEEGLSIEKARTQDYLLSITRDEELRV